MKRTYKHLTEREYNLAKMLLKEGVKATDVGRVIKKSDTTICFIKKSESFDNYLKVRELASGKVKKAGFEISVPVDNSDQDFLLLSKLLKETEYIKELLIELTKHVQAKKRLF